MNDLSINIRTVFTGFAALIFVVTVCLIGWKIIDTFCQLSVLVAHGADGEINQTRLKEQTQGLKDWGGLVLGFFFGAAANFVGVALLGSKLVEPQSQPHGEKPLPHGS